MLSHARILWEGKGESRGGNPAPYCRVVIGIKEGKTQVAYEEAFSLDSMGGYIYHGYSTGSIPIEFFIAMDERTKLHSSRLSTLEREPR